MDLSFDDLIPQDQTLSFDDLVPKSVLSAAPPETGLTAIINGLQSNGLLSKNNANRIRRQFSKPADTLGRAVKRGGTFGVSNLAEAGIDAIDPTNENFGEFSEALNQITDRDSSDRQNHPTVSALGEIAGGVASGGAALNAGLTTSRLIPQATRGLKGALARTGAAATDGAVIGATTAAGDQRDIATGAATGAATGGVLQGGAEALTGIAGKILRRIQTSGLLPEQKAQQNVFDEIQRQGGNDAIQSQLQKLGPDAVLGDVITGGSRQIRAAGNLSPEAQDIALERLVGRRQGQNQRLADNLSSAVGLKGDETVEGLQNSIRERFRPRVNQRFEAAREAGAELPREPFREILQTPIGGREFQKAQRNVQNDIPIRGKNADSDLSILDETIRGIRDRGQSLTQSGQRNQGARNFGIASELRKRVDDALSGDEFKAARALRQRQGQREDALEAGAKLSQNNGNVNALTAQQFENRFNPQLQKGFVANELSVLNSNSNNSANVLNRLNSPNVRRFINERFTPNQQSQITSGTDSERVFNRTLQGSSGNSTTVQQGLDILDGGGTIQDAVNAIGNLSTGGVSGALKSGANVLAKNVTKRGARLQAPFIADILTQNQLPESVINNLTPQQIAQRQAIIQLLSRSGVIAGTP